MNKQLQEQRIRGYFMQAAREIITGEGLQALNVRNIADRAGYSYATLYNYFKDVKELVFLCVKDFQQEISDTVNAQTLNLRPGCERIKVIVNAYIGYLVQYPSVFALFFTEKMGDIGNRQPSASSIYHFLDSLCNSDWQQLIAAGLLEEPEAILRRKQLNYLCCGMLLFYMHRHQPESYLEFAATANELIDNILLF